MLVNTAMGAGNDAHQPLDAPPVDGEWFVAGGRSVVVLAAGRN